LKCHYFLLSESNIKQHPSSPLSLSSQQHSLSQGTVSLIYLFLCVYVSQSFCNDLSFAIQIRKL
jgi:hypothetical protein